MIPKSRLKTFKSTAVSTRQRNQQVFSTTTTTPVTSTNPRPQLFHGSLTIYTRIRLFHLITHSIIFFSFQCFFDSLITHTFCSNKDLDNQIKMYSGIVLLAFLVVYVAVSLSSGAQDCPKDFQCGNLGNLSFPFTDSAHPNCGLCMANCSSDQPSLNISLSHQTDDREYELRKSPLQGNSIRVLDTNLQDYLNKQMCSSFFHTIRQADSTAFSFTVEPNITMIRCMNDINTIDKSGMETLKSLDNFTLCHDFTIYYRNPKDDDKPLNNIGPLPQQCHCITLPMAPEDSITKKSGLFGLLTAEFDLFWHLSDNCVACLNGKGSQCDGDNSFCANAGKHVSKGKSKMGIIIGTTVTGVFFILVSLCCGFFVWYRGKVIKGGLYRRSKGIAELAVSKSDLEDGSVYCGIPVFSFTELEEITNSFNESNELGNGGFGTVYYGKLRDGREVAVKYLYEHNFKRMQQFKTEVEILTRLRHQNLVTLYGCTSRRSRDLLLVYEYIPNGTIADHLHGSRAKEGSLPWPIRMNIAIETADALAYLHASDIIHRDVKSNNILLDNNFCVKVADFGLSRLFPHDVTHISTAPQGTPGYVDPEYHQCYQLTDKSDVYSFGVVLIELISSMPAVDMSRKSHDINLSSFAISRIQSCAFDELIDPSLHIESDPEVKRMTTSVAELAFRCLQNEKEMRPTMEEVAVTLREIQIYEDNIGTIERETNQNEGIRSRTPAVPPSPESEDVVLLRKKFILPYSPTSVTETWSSASTTGTSR